MSKVFVSTDARRPYPRGVIGSTVGTYPMQKYRFESRLEEWASLIPSALSFVFL